MAPNTSVSVSYAVTVDAGAYNQTVRNVVTTKSPGGQCGEPTQWVVPECLPPRARLPSRPRLHRHDPCSTEHFTPHYVLSKTSNPPSGSTVEPASEITYSLRVHNDSDVAVTGAVVTDNLSDVLNHASAVLVGCSAPRSPGPPLPGTSRRSPRAALMPPCPTR